MAGEVKNEDTYDVVWFDLKCAVRKKYKSYYIVSVVHYRQLNCTDSKKCFSNPKNWKIIFWKPNMDRRCSPLYTFLRDTCVLQVPKEKTAFVTPSETPQFERIVFGLITAY